MRRFARRGFRRKTIWVETQDALIDQATSYGTASGVSSANTFFAPLLANELDVGDKADMPFDEKSANLLGISNWGTALGEVYQRGWKATRLVGKLRFALQQRDVASGAGAQAQATNVFVRAGIFVGEVSENGELQNATDWLLHTQADWKDRRWLWVREWSLHNSYANLSTNTASFNGGGAFADTTGIIKADLPRVVWGPPSTEFYQSHMDNSVFDVKRVGSLARNQRLMYAFASWDHAVGVQQTAEAMTSAWILVRNKTCRALMSPGFKRAR